MNTHSRHATRSLFTTEARKGSSLCSLQFVASVIIVIGFFGPWVANRTAALTLTGYELSDFAKFFPQVQGGVVPVTRALFVTPLLAGAISLALIIHRFSSSPLLRLGAAALTALLCLTALPPFQSIMDRGYRIQLALIVGGVLLTLAAPLARQLSERVRGLQLLFLTLAGALPAFWQAILLQPLVADLYGSAILPGWGFLSCGIGFFALLITSLRSIIHR